MPDCQREQGLGVETDWCLLALLGAEVTYMNMTAYNKGRLQSSFWIVDKQHVYIGSAGLDWRSLGQVIIPSSLNSTAVAIKMSASGEHSDTYGIFFWGGGDAKDSTKGLGVLCGSWEKLASGGITGIGRSY